MSADDPKTLVSTQWLADHLNDPDLRILDASWYLPDMGRDAKAEYDAAHIPGARFYDLDDQSDTVSDLPHMAPSPEKFMSRMRAMGVGDGHQVVVYDGNGIFSAARVWWLFRLMGKIDIAVLDGGFGKWQAEGRPVEDMPPMVRDRHMTAQRQAHWSRTSRRWPPRPSWAIGRSSMRAGRTGFAATRRNRAKACARATFPAPGTCITPRF